MLEAGSATAETLHGIIVDGIVPGPSQTTPIAEWDAPVAVSQNCVRLGDLRHEAGYRRGEQITRSRSVQPNY